MQKRILLISLTMIIAFLFFSAGCGEERTSGLGNKGQLPSPPSGEERKFVALGSSFTKGNNLSQEMVGDYPEYSFATGTKIESVYQYLKKQGGNLTSVNLAESGAESKDILEKQVPNVAGFAPKYITLDVGADLVVGRTPAQLRENLTQIITQIQGEDTIIFILTYPDFTKLRKAPHPACQEDKLRLGFGEFSQEQIQSFNEVIQEAATQYNLALVDLYGLLGAEDVSDYDCLHLNQEGQEKVAQTCIQALNKQ